MSDDVQEFTKDNPPDPLTGGWYRSTEIVFAHRIDGDAKVGGKKVQGGFVVVDDVLENKEGRIRHVDGEEFNAKFAPASASEIPRVQGPHYDAIEASKEQADGIQFEPKVKGDEVAARTLANQTGA